MWNKFLQHLANIGFEISRKFNDRKRFERSINKAWKRSYPMAEKLANEQMFEEGYYERKFNSHLNTWDYFPSKKVFEEGPRQMNEYFLRKKKEELVWYYFEKEEAKKVKYRY